MENELLCRHLLIHAQKECRQENIGDNEAIVSFILRQAISRTSGASITSAHLFEEKVSESTLEEYITILANDIVAYANDYATRCKFYGVDNANANETLALIRVMCNIKRDIEGLAKNYRY